MEKNTIYSSIIFHQEDIAILNIDTPNTRTPNFIKATLLYLKSHNDPHIVTVGDLNIPLSNSQVIHTKIRQRNAGAN